MRIFSEQHRKKLREARKRQVSWIKGKNQTKEHIRKRVESRVRNGTTPAVTSPRGKDHYLWVADRSQLKQYWTERNNPEYKQWRQRVFKRDNGVCGLKNNRCAGKNMAHHILPWSKFPKHRYKTNNGITLCRHHHPQTRKDEIKMAPILTRLIAD